MIKTLFASACVLACCIGNEYPAKAECSSNSWGGRRYCELQEESWASQERVRERVELDSRLHRIEQEIHNPTQRHY